MNKHKVYNVKAEIQIIIQRLETLQTFNGLCRKEKKIEPKKCNRFLKDVLGSSFPRFLKNHH